VTLLLAALTAAPICLAVVHGIQPQSNHRYESSHRDGTENRDGYRYNGPAHKYLPAASTPTTEAVTITGHWQPNPLPLNPLQHQLPPYEHTYSSKPATQQQQLQPGYNGPYNMQYYGEHQQPQQQLSSNSWREEQQQQQQNSDHRWQQPTKLQQLPSNSLQQQQLLGNKWQQQQPLVSSNGWQQQQKQQPLVDSSWREQQQQEQQHHNHEQQQQQYQPSSNAWQQQQHKHEQQQPANNAWQPLSENAWQPETSRQQLQQRQQQLLAQHDSNMLHAFPFATPDKTVAGGATMAEPGASVALSAAAHGHRLLASELRVPDQLMTSQALPLPQQQQPFVGGSHSYESELGGSTHYVQMQSNSYELPSS
ncbi:hypothetical protein KR044_000525, partial [Drosophila immigrans]